MISTSPCSDRVEAYVISMKPLPFFLSILLAVFALPGANLFAQNFGTPNGGAPPLAYVMSPEKGATVKAGRPLTIKAGANSFNGVRNVTFYINGRRVATDGRRPFNYTFTPRSGSYTVRVKARGFFGNWKMSPAVTFRAR